MLAFPKREKISFWGRIWNGRATENFKLRHKSKFKSRLKSANNMLGHLKTSLTQASRRHEV